MAAAGSWSIAVSLGRHLLDVVTVGDGDAITVGEAADCTVVLPGVQGDRRFLVRDGLLLPVAGLACATSRVEAGTLRLEAGSHVDFYVSQYPAVCVRVRRDGAENLGLARWSGGFLLRELLYGVSLGACLMALCAIDRPTATATAAGDPAADGRIARLMMSGPVAFAPTQSLPTPPSASEQKPLTVDAPSQGPAPPTKVDDAPPPTSSVPSDGDSSHSAYGDAAPRGHARGLAALHGDQRCANPKARSKENIDVVFVIDVSTTMGFVLDRLAGEIAAVDAQVRSTDPNPHYGLVVFVDDVLVTHGGGAFSDVGALQREFKRWARFTSTNRQLRSEAQNVDWPENSLDALHAAATRFNWRAAEDTLRLVVHATDDDFRERGAELSGLAVRHTYRDTVQALKDADVRVATFAARIGGRCECDDVSPGWFSRYRGRQSIPNATGGAAFDVDEVIAGRTSLGDAVTATIKNAVCPELAVPWR